MGNSCCKEGAANGVVNPTQARRNPGERSAAPGGAQIPSSVNQKFAQYFEIISNYSSIEKSL